MKVLKSKFSRIFLSFTTVILLLGLGLADPLGHAQHIYHHHHVEIKYQNFKRRHHKVMCFRKHHSSKRIHRLTKGQVNRNCTEINFQISKDINNDRYRNHLSRLKVNRQLFKIGNERSHQLQKYFSHNTLHHQNELRVLLNRRHIK